MCVMVRGERDEEGGDRHRDTYTWTDMGERGILLIQTKENLEDFPKSVTPELSLRTWLPEGKVGARK